MQPPIWKKFVNVSGFAERNRSAIADENRRLREEESAGLRAKSGIGTVRFDLGGGVYDERDAEELEDDPVYGGIATEALFKRELKNWRDQADALDIELSDPSKPRKLTESQRAEILAEGAGLGEDNPRHAELKKALMTDEEIQAKEKAKWEAKKRLQELGQMGVNGFRQQRVQSRLSEAAKASQAISEQEQTIAAREAEGVKGRDLQAHAAEKAQVMQQKQVVETQKQSAAGAILEEPNEEAKKLAEWQSMKPDQRLAKKLQDSKLFSGITQSIGIASDKSLVRRPDGSWDTPAVVKQYDNQIFNAVKSGLTAVRAKAGLRGGGTAEETQAMNEALYQFQQENNLSDEEVVRAWNDFTARNNESWQDDEKLRVLSDGEIILNASAPEILDRQKLSKVIESANAPAEQKARALENLEFTRKNVAEQRLMAYEAAGVGIESPSEYAARTGRGADMLNDPDFILEYEQKVLGAEGEVAKKARGLAGDVVLGLNILTTGVLGVGAQMTNSETLGQLAADGSEGTQVVNQGKPDTGIVGDVIQQAPSLLAMVVGAELIGAAGATAGVGATAMSWISRAGSLTMAGGQSLGATYADERAQGKTHEEAEEVALRSGINTAIITGVFNALPGMAGFEKYTGGAQKKVADVTMREILKSTSRQELAARVSKFARDKVLAGVSEGLEEGVDELTNAFINAEPDTNLSTAWKNAIEAAKVGALIGTAVDVAGSTGFGNREKINAAVVAAGGAEVTPEEERKLAEIAGEEVDPAVGAKHVLAMREIDEISADAPELALRASGSLKIARGMPLEELTSEEITALGVDRTGKPLGGETSAMVEMVNGRPILLDPAIRELETAAPSSKGLISMTEGEARQKFAKTKFTVTSKGGKTVEVEARNDQEAGEIAAKQFDLGDQVDTVTPLAATGGAAKGKTPTPIANTPAGAKPSQPVVSQSPVTPGTTPPPSPAVAVVEKIRAKSKGMAKLITVSTDPATRVMATDAGITVNPDALMAEAVANGLDEKQSAEWVGNVIDEEVRHMAQFRAAESLYKKSKSKLSLEAWRSQHYGAVWNTEFVATGKAEIVRKLYGEEVFDQLPEWKKAMEGIRMMWQQNESQSQTETAKLWTRVSDAVIAELKAVLEVLKSLAKDDALSPSMKRELALLQKKLKELETAPEKPAAKPAAAASQGPFTAGQRIEGTVHKDDAQFGGQKISGVIAQVTPSGTVLLVQADGIARPVRVLTADAKAVNSDKTPDKKPESKPEAPAAVSALPAPTAQDWQDRAKFVGEHFAGPPNSVVIQPRDMDSNPIGEHIVLPLQDSMEATAEMVASGFTQAIGNGSWRESLVKVIGADGKAVAQMKYDADSGKMLVAKQSDLESARAKMRQNQSTPPATTNPQEVSSEPVVESQKPSPKKPKTVRIVPQPDGGVVAVDTTPEEIEFEVQSLRPGAPKETLKVPANPAPSVDTTLEEARKKARNVLDGLFAANLRTEEFNKAIPQDRFMQLMDAANSMLQAGINTPEALAAEMATLAPDRKAVPFTQRFWFALQAAGAQGAAEPDWAAIYSAMDAPVDRKQAEEQRELEMVKAAREIVQGKGTAKEKYDQLVEAYENMPALNAKTSTSKINQAFSTPIPMAYAASIMGDLKANLSTSESSGGHASLLMEVKADNPNVYFNELNPRRLERVKTISENWKFTNNDATTQVLPKKVKRVAGNPPFGSITLDDGTKKVFTTEMGETTTIDHAILLQDLSNMDEDGRAVFIIGGPPPLAKSEKGRREYYSKGAASRFFEHLYENYGVIDHVTVNGDLYKKQGAGWPVDIIVIQGKSKSKTALPSAKVPRMLNTWDEVFNQSQLTDNERIQSRTLTEAEVSANIRGLADDLAGIRGQRDADTDDGPRAIPDGRPTGQQGAGAGVRGGSNETTPDRPDADIAPGGQSGSDEAGTGQRPAGRPGDSNQSDARGSRQDASSKPVTKFQSKYTPFSEGNTLDTLIPSNMADAVVDAFERIKKDVGGDLVTFVKRELGYKPGEDINKHFAGEQIDALAAAIWNFERGGALIVGDQTGIGKGRIAAGLMRYAVNKGLTPVFVTEKPNLLDSMLRGDLADIDADTIVKPSILLAEMSKFEEGKKRKLPFGKKYFERVSASGKLGEGANAIFTLYSQIQADTDSAETKESREKAKRNGEAPRSGWRTAALQRLAPNAVFILDESHNAAGASITGFRMAEILAGSSRVYYSSATSAKRPENMGIYFKTNIGKVTNGSMEKLTEIMQSGGVPAMQLGSYMLARDGQYLRRERSFEGIKFETTITTDTAERDAALADNLTFALRQIVKVQERMMQVAEIVNERISKVGKGAKIPASNRTKLESANFSSKVHNVVSQYLLAIKTKAAVAESIKAVREGKKVVVGLSNTMESAIDDLRQFMNDPDTDFTMTYKGLVMRYLDKMRVMKNGKEEFVINGTPSERFKNYSTNDLFMMAVRKEGSGEDGTVSVNQEVVEEIVRRYMWDEYTAARDQVRRADLGDLPLSPIDAMRQAMEEYGVRTGEITGRTTGIDTNGEIYERSESEVKLGGVRYRDAFNDEDLDFLVINQSGSTGINLHASEKAKNKKPRKMIVVQPALDINTFMQMLGRIHRSGQVELPEFSLLQTALPAEFRPAAILAVKMAMLNANTTSNAKSDVSEGNQVTDMFNKYGDAVVYAALERDPDLQNQLAPFGSIFKKIIKDEGGMISFQEAKEVLAGQVDGYIARAVTGYLAVLPVEEQQMFWDKITAEYNAMIDYLNEMGQNDLESKALELKAKTTSREVFTGGGQGDSVFEEPSYVETVETAIGKQPLTGAKAVEVAKAAKVEMRKISDDYYRDATQKIEQRIQQAKAKAVKWNAEKEAKMRGDMIENRNTIANALRMLGAMGSIKREDGSTGLAVIESVKLDPEKPFAPGSQVFTLQVNDGRRTLKISASKIKEAFEPQFESASEWDSTTFVGSTRNIVTGNLLAAIDKLKGTGQIISYTTDSGQTQMGVLLPAGFTKRVEAEKGRTRNLKTIEDFAKAFADEARVTTVDKAVKLLPVDGGVEIRVPASRSAGGKYWTKPALNALMIKGEFMQISNDMRATFPMDRLQQVIDLIGEPFVAIEKVASQDDDMDTSLEAARLNPNYTYRQSVRAGLTQHIVRAANERTGKMEDRVFDTLAEAQAEMDRIDELMSPATEADMADFFTWAKNGLAAAPLAPFYSKLERVIDQKMPNVANAGQVMQIAMQNAKAEEVKWSGLQQALVGMQDEKGKVTKAAVLEHLRNEGSVRFEEVSVRSKQDIAKEIEANGYEISDGYIVDPETGDYIEDPEDVPQNVRDLAMEYDKNEDVRYAKYQLPGGENYREVVLAMPNDGARSDADARQLYLSWSKLGDKPWESLTESDRQMWRGRAGYASTAPAPTYTSSHFPDVPNYVAHMRLNERDGGLFIEELQSDRHQEGRKKGYKEDLPPVIDIAPIQEELRLLRIQRNEQGETPALNQLIEDTEQRLIDTQSPNVKRFNAIPDAPFRTTWPLALFKRALRDAVASGKEWIGWTTGVEQVSRYENEMRSKIDEVTWQTVNGNKSIRAIKNEAIFFAGNIDSKGNIQGSGTEADGKSVADVFGKGIAEKVGDDYKGSLSGDGLTIGGEGMKRFYDVMLPSDIGKYVKQWGAKVKRSEISTNEKEGPFIILDEGGNDIGAGPFPTQEDALDYMESEVADEDATIGYADGGMGKAQKYPIWRIDITDDMRKGVESGQELFAAPLAPRSVTAVTEAKFDRIYAQHLDLRTRGVDAVGLRDKILREGFKKGANVNALPVTRGRAPSNVIERNFQPKAGDLVLLAPKEFWKMGANGIEIKNGWKPKPYEAIIIKKDNPDMYEEYLSAIKAYESSVTTVQDVDAIREKFVETAKQEILNDIASGDIPASVRSFEELNDYVDANEYVNDANREDRALGPYGKSKGWKTQDYIDFTNGVIDELNDWLASGDAAYLAAVEAGDMETAQRMVDSAAKAAGYTEKVFHSSKEKGITVFQRLFPNFFSKDREYTKGYGDTTYDLWLKIENPFNTENPEHLKAYNEKFVPYAAEAYEDSRYQPLKEGEKVPFTTADALFHWLKSQTQKGQVNVDGIVVDERTPNWTKSDTLVPITASQIKSADPVTRDEQGNVIPLSQRFNPASDSILYAANLNGMNSDRVKEAMAQQQDFGNAVKPPNRASMGDETTRKAVDVFDIEYEERRERETRKQWVEGGTERAKNNRKALIENAKANAYGEVGAVPLTPEDIVGTQIIIEQMVKEAGNDFDKLIEAGTVIQAYRTMRSNVARVLASGWDRLMKPEERNRRFLANAILTLPPKVAAQIARKQLTPEQSKIEIRRELQERLTKIEKALKEYGVTINEVLGKQVYVSLDKKNVVKDIMKDATKDEALAIRMHQQHADAAKIAKTCHMTVAEVEKLVKKVYDEALARMIEKARAGMTLETSGLQAATLLTEEQIIAEARRMVEVGLGLSPTVHTPSTRALARKAKIKVESEPEKINWSRPEFTSGLLSYTFDSKDLAEIKRTSQALIDATAATAKVETLTGKKRQEAEAMLAKLESILAKYGTSVQQVVESGKPLESYRFDITDRVHVHLIANAIRSVDADAIDKGVEWYYFSMLSGLQTMMVNASSVVHGIFDATIGRGAEMILNAFLRNPMNASLGETKYILKAMGPMMSRARSNFAASFGAETPFFEQDILGVPPDLESVLEGHGMYHRTAISGKKGQFIRIPTRILLATDEYVKTINAMTEVGAMAYRICRAGDLKPGTKEFDDKMKELVNIPGSLAWQMAASKAYNRTFTNALPGQKDLATGKTRDTRTVGEVFGGIVGKTQGLLQSGPSDTMTAKLGKTLLRLMFFPFVKVPYNITALAMTYTPLSLIDIATLYAQSRGIKGKAERQKAQAEVIERMSRVMIGGIVAGFMLGAGEGDDDDLDKPLLITGSRPYKDTKKGVRELGQRMGVDAYSISWKLPNGKRGVFHYGRVEPIATVLATTIDTMRELKQAGRGRQDYGEAMTKAVSSFTNQLSDKTFLKGIGDAYKTVMGEQNMSKFVADKLAMAVPNLIKQPIRETDPYFRDKADTFGEELLSAIYPSGIREPKVDIYGEKSTKLGNSLTRIFDFSDAGTVAVRKVDEMLWRYQQKNPDASGIPTIASDKYTPVTGEGQKEMTEKQARMYRERAGQNLTNMLKSRTFNYENPTERDIDNLNKLIEAARKSAKTALKYDPNWK